MYKIYRADNKVVAISTYAGKTVRGIAKCDPRDDFSDSFGEELATARCNAKVSVRRVKNAQKRLAEAAKALEAAQKQYDRMSAYYNDAIKLHTEADEAVYKLLETTP